MNRMALVSFMVFLILLPAAYAQQYSYRHYTIFDGLPQNQVMKVSRIHLGVFLFATKNEVCGFDGNRFLTFNDRYLNESPVQGFLILGRNTYAYTQNALLQFRNKSVQRKMIFRKNKVRLIKADYEKQALYLISDSGFQKICYQGESSFIKNPSPAGLCDVARIPGTSHFIMSTQGGIFLKKDHEKPVLLIKGQGAQVVTIKKHIYFIIVREDGNYSEFGGVFSYYRGKIRKIYSFGKNIPGNVLSATSNDDLIIVQNNSTWIRMDTLGNIIDRDSLPDVIINDIAEDIEKNLVIGSESGVFHLQSYAFRNYDWKSGMPRYVWSIFEDRDSSIVFATYHGLLFRMKDNKLSEVEGYRKQLMANEVFYMGGFSNSLGQWMIPTNYRIFVYDHGKISFIPLIHKGNFSTCLATYEDKAAQKVYFGTTNGLFIYELSGGKTTHVDTEGRTVLSIEKDRHGHLWICTGKKVLLLENDTVFHGGHDESPVNTGVVSCCMDSAGNMWYVTREGLNFYNYKNHISIADGHYYFITLWQNRKIIAGGVEGVTVIDLEKFYKLDITGIQQFDRFNGFTGIECGQNGTCVDTKGNVWIPASESVVKFRPDRVTYDTIPPEPYVVSFECSRKNLVWREQLIPIRDRKYSFELQPGLSNIRIIYDGLDYSSRERIKFRYRLVGYSDIWKETSRGEAVFTNLSPGWYSFELQSANENGYWSKIPRVIEFRIRPYFYQTFGFRLAVLILSVSLIVFLIILYFLRLQKRTAKEKEVEKKLVAMQVKTINAQLDPHFIFNTITAIGSEVQEKNNDKAYAYFVKVSQLLRQSIKITDRITRPLTEEIEFVKNYLSLQKFRFDDRFEYMFNISSDVDLHTDVPKMCLQIFVENAMKHGIEQLSSGGRLLIVISCSNNGIRFIIEDNGIGREASARNGNNSTGVGLLVFKEFFDIMNQYNTHEAGFTVHDLYENGFASGTRVELFIPDDYQYPVQ